MTLNQAALEKAIEDFIHAYRKKYSRPSTGGIRQNAPMYKEVSDLNAALIAEIDAREAGR